MIVKELNKQTTYPATSVASSRPPTVTLPRLPATHQRLPPWTKLTYTRWIEGVKEKFKVGDLVCWKGAPKYTNITQPPFYYIVEGFQEMFPYVTFNGENLPNALYLRVAEASNATPQWRVPDHMRHLTPEEVALVNLRAKEKQEQTNPSAICLTTDG